MALLPYRLNIQALQTAMAPSQESTGPNLHLTASNMVKYRQKQMEMRHLLDQVKVQKDNLKGLVLIDSIQRLGLDHHFQDQITQTLNTQYQDSQSLLYNCDHLYTVSLRFRLLRQHGFNVSADVFNKFKGVDMKLKDALLWEDIRGVMALHEASHLCMQGEDILDEAAIFTTKLLADRLPHLDHHLALMAQNTLNYPYHKSLPRFTSKNYLELHEFKEDWEKLLADLAIMDFNATQYIYHDEVLQLLKWWNGLGLSEELKQARNQPLKWYIWAMGMVTDPCLSKQRVEIAKPISLVYVVDDIFDVYGTLDDLTLFTEAIKRWEFPATGELPSYMELCLKVIRDTTVEISNTVCQEFGWNPIDHLKNEWANLCDAFLMEAKWFSSGHSPKAEDYLKNGIISSGVPMVLTNLFFLLGYGSDGETTKHIEAIISSPAAILRLTDDLGSAKDEEQEGKDGSYVEYYTRPEGEESSMVDGREHVKDLVSEEWKLLNKRCLSATPIPPSFRSACLNFARMIPVMYGYNDTHRLPVLEDHINFMFSDIKGGLMC